MWSRVTLKARCKAVMKRNYWMMLLVAFIGLMLSGGYANDPVRNARDAIQNIDDISISFGFFSYFLHTPFDWSINYTFSFTIFAFFLIILGAIIGILYHIFVANPIQCGMCRYFLKNTEETPPFSTLFSTFSKDYLNVVGVMFLRDIKVLLWSLLLIIPGIIKSYEYRMIPYLLAEDPSMSSTEAFARTKQMTEGQKMEIFILDLSFLGWRILGNLLIIGKLFVDPYAEGTYAELYLVLATNSVYE